MNQTIITAIIGAVGMVFGAIIAALASTFSAKQKIRELEMKYRQQLKENYLANARAYTNSIYIPIDIAITELARHYEAFRKKIDFNSGTADEVPLDRFRSACVNYNGKMNELYSKGADAFLITELDEKLRSFNDFIKDSIDATEPVRNVVLSYKLKVPGFTSLSAEKTEKVPLKGRIVRVIHPIKISLGFLGTRITYQAEKVLAASLISREFEERMITDVPELKFLIKEVTLGAHIKKK